jgi:predicted nuclease of predicted toxin-antitoxin system
MLRLAADENFNNHILRGLRRRCPGVDIVRIQDTDLSGMDDPAILEWAAVEGRVLLTHDVNTVTKFAYERVAVGQPMPGVFVVLRFVPLGQTIEDLSVVVGCSRAGEWEGRVLYLPLR